MSREAFCAAGPGRLISFLMRKLFNLLPQGHCRFRRQMLCMRMPLAASEVSPHGELSR